MRVCNNLVKSEQVQASNIISNIERDLVARTGNYQRAVGWCETVVQAVDEFPSGVGSSKFGRVTTTNAQISKAIRVRPLSRRSIKPVFFAKAKDRLVLGEAVAATQQRNKVVTRKLRQNWLNFSSLLLDIRRGVFLYLFCGIVTPERYEQPSPIAEKVRIKMVQHKPDNTATDTSGVTQIYKMRGVRGAISVPENSAPALYAAAEELLQRILAENQIEADDICSIFFTTTSDLDAAFPALVARTRLGLTDVAMLCGHEMDVPGAMPQILRVLMHVNTTKTAAQIRHVYLGDAVNLRPDKAK